MILLEMADTPETVADKYKQSEQEDICERCNKAIAYVSTTILEPHRSLIKPPAGAIEATFRIGRDAW